jgi:hypothetical protein
MPASYTVWVKTYHEAVAALETGYVTHMSFDHDLGLDLTGYDVAKWVEAEAYAGRLHPFNWVVHSANPIGAERIRDALSKASQYWRAWSEQPYAIYETVGIQAHTPRVADLADLSLCTGCGRPHGLTALDAGTDREVKRVCATCAKSEYHDLTAECEAKRFFQVVCAVCGWQGCSCQLDAWPGYDGTETCCPECGAPDPEEDCDY